MVGGRWYVKHGMNCDEDGNMQCQILTAANRRRRCVCVCGCVCVGRGGGGNL